ncbi:MAG: DM13 domain-containing protein [Actinomycetota bacterium]
MSTITDTIRRHWKIALPGAALVVAGLAWLAFGFFGIHTAFFDNEVDEAGPVFASGAGASGLPSDAIDDDLADAMNDAMDEDDIPTVDEVDEESAMADGEIEIVTLAEGQFIDRSHPAVGTALVLNDGTDQRFLRFEDFATDNGPDLNVYLTTADADAPAGDFDDEFIDLGDLKGNIGSQNYEIPPDVDLERFDTVVIWCVRFGVAFGAADLEVMPSAA